MGRAWYLACVNELLAAFLGALTRVQNTATAAVLAAFFTLGLRSLVLLARAAGQGWATAGGRAAAAVFFLGAGALYATFTLAVLTWDLPAVGAAVATAVVIGIPAVVRGLAGWGATAGRVARTPRVSAALFQLVLLLSLLLVATLTLMRAGFLALTTDRPVLLVDVTGETAVQRVRWAAPDAPPREEELTTHHVVLRTPEGAAVSEVWLYGDQVAVKGRVLRLSPLLNAAGVPNLFELQFVHNGWLSAERHNTYPHVARALQPMGPLAVHPWWRGLQRRLLARFEGGGEGGGSDWSVRAVTTESTYFPLATPDGRPVRQTYRLVLTPGGLSAG